MSGIWNKSTAYNKDAQQLNTLEKEYCKETTSKDYIMGYNIFEKGSLQSEEQWSTRQQFDQYLLD